jgi:hypothetical protein
MASGANITRLITIVIYGDPVVLLSLRVIKQYDHVNYNRLTVKDYHSKFYNIGPRWQT